MAQLRRRDFEAVLSFLTEAQDLDGPAPFTPALLDRLAEIVGCEYATFCEIDPTPAFIREIECSAGETGDGEVEDDWWTCGRTVRLRQYKSQSAKHLLVLSDVFSREERTRPDFNPNFPDYGVADEIQIDLDPKRKWTAALSVSGSRDFGGRERLILRLLQPHVAGMYRNAELRRRLSAATATLDPDATVDLTPREREVMLCVADGLSNARIAAVLVIELSTVRKHLEHVYDKLGVRSRTAALAKLRG